MISVAFIHFSNLSTLGFKLKAAARHNLLFVTYNCSWTIIAKNDSFNVHEINHQYKQNPKIIIFDRSF